MIVHWKFNESIVYFLENKLPLIFLKASDKNLYNMGALHIL